MTWRTTFSAFAAILTRRRLAIGIGAGVGAAIAIGGMEFLSAVFNYPLAIIPFATSIVLVMSSPELPAAQPRALIGGHIVSTLVGLAVVKIVGPQPWAAAFAVGVAVLAMVLTDTLHPPAGIDPLLIVSANLSWAFLIVPVLAGVSLLTVFAFVWHRWIRRQLWPERWP
jgi:CBS-domain-containing membrane protein